MAPGYEEVVRHTGLAVVGSLHHGVLGVAGEVRGVGQREGPGLQLLVELRPTEAVLLLCISIVVIVQTAPLSLVEECRGSALIGRYLP